MSSTVDPSQYGMNELTAQTIRMMVGAKSDLAIPQAVLDTFLRVKKRMDLVSGGAAMSVGEMAMLVEIALGSDSAIPEAKKKPDTKPDTKPTVKLATKGPPPTNDADDEDA